MCVCVCVSTDSSTCRLQQAAAACCCCCCLLLLLLLLLPLLRLRRRLRSAQCSFQSLLGRDVQFAPKKLSIASRLSDFTRGDTVSRCDAPQGWRTRRRCPPSFSVVCVNRRSRCFSVVCVNWRSRCAAEDHLTREKLHDNVVKQSG